MTHKVRDLLCSVIMLIFGAVMFIVALDIPHKIESDVGSGFVPKFIAICIMVVAVVQGVLTLLDNRRPPRQKTSCLRTPRAASLPSC